jgi:hypothetical protein
MDRKLKFQKIKEMFGMIEKVKKVEEVNLTIIAEISKWNVEVEQKDFKVGTKVTYKMDEDDDITYNVPSREYILENGDSIQVDSDGIIVLITPKDAETKEDPKEEVKEDPKEEVKASKKVKEEFSDTTLKDGVNVQYDKLEIGGHLLIKNSEGEFTAAPAGEYELNDGTIVIVNEENLINEVKPADEVEEVETIESLTLRIAELELLVEGLAPNFEASVQKVDKLSTDFEAHQTRFNEFAKSEFIESKPIKEILQTNLSNVDRINNLKEINK